MSAVRRIALPSLLLSAIVVLAGPSPASAHTGFEWSQPADGDALDAPVAEIVLTYSGPADPAGEGFQVLAPTGTLRAPDSVTVDADRQIWTLGFDPPLASGTVGVRWSVQAPDAHPIDGTFSFTVGDLAPDPVPSSPDPEGSGLDSATGLDGSSSIPSAGDPREPEALTAPTSDRVGATDSGPQAAIDLDAFLAPGDTPVPFARLIGAGGRLIGFVGTMVTIGGLAFAAVVVRHHRRDLRSVLEVVSYAALAIVAGTVLDLVAHLAVANGAWSEVVARAGLESVATSPFGMAIGLRAAAGTLLFTTVRAVGRPLAPIVFVAERRELVTVAAEAIRHPADAADRWSHSPTSDGPPSESPALDRAASITSRPVSPWWPISPTALALTLGLLASFTLDGHTVTEGDRWVTGAVDMVHVVAASIWAGGVVASAVVLWRRHSRYERLDGLELALRFSTLAGAGLALAGVAGTVLAAIILDEVSQLWTTPWGRLLMAKTLAVAAAAAVGAYNHFVVIPWMGQHPNDDSRSVRLRNTATTEAILLLAVIALTAVLVGASAQAS